MTRRPEIDFNNLFAPLRAVQTDVEVGAEVFRRLRAGLPPARTRPTGSQFLPAVGISTLFGAIAVVKLTAPLLASPWTWGAAAAGCARAAMLSSGVLLESLRSLAEGLATAALRTAAVFPTPPGSLSFAAATAGAATALAALAIISCVAAAMELHFHSFERSSSR